MKTSSAKAKGKRALMEARDMMLSWYPDLGPDDIRVVPSGVPGEDMWFSPKAQAALGLIVEGKNQEAMNVWASLEQAEEHAEKLDKKGQRNGRVPALIFKRNRSKLYIAMSLEDYLSVTGVWNASKTRQEARGCLECPGSTRAEELEDAIPEGVLAN